MFNVAILKMKDIIKYVIGIVLTATIIIFISKQFSKDTKNEEKIVNEFKNGISMLSEKSFLSCFNQTSTIMANTNKEYTEVAKEDDHSKESFLQGILKTQISSINEIEKQTTNIQQTDNEVKQNQTQEASQDIRNTTSRCENRSYNK